MSITNLFGLLGGLGLFLYGMQMISSGLEAAAGNKMKKVLEKLTSNRFLGVGIGAGITALIQSSSATTVMLVGFVNSGLITLRQAVWIIMGANIGTTSTGLLIALDVGMLAPLFAFIGVAMISFFKNPRLHHYGKIIAGLGVLFIGMEMMSEAMYPLRESEAFISLMTRFSNPLLGILAGALFTAVIQSSAASIGILQTLAVSGLIGLPSAAFILFGQNIGTCITAVLASFGTNRNAKRTTIVHLLFNIIGTVIFTVIFMITPISDWIMQMAPGLPAVQIANVHILFNISTTLLLLPFGQYLAVLATKILPELPAEKENQNGLIYLKMPVGTRDHKIGTSTMIITGLWRELERMLGLVRDNVDQSFTAIMAASSEALTQVEDREESIDCLNKNLANYISHVIAYEDNERDSALINAFFKISSDLERIGDHAMNLCGYTKLLEQKSAQLSDAAKAEMIQMQEISRTALSYIDEENLDADTRLEKIVTIEQKIDDMTEQFRQNQLARMRTGSCSNETCVLYSEMLTDFERIGDHILNIGQAMSHNQFVPEQAADSKPAVVVPAK